MIKNPEDFFDDISEKWSNNYKKRDYLSNFFISRMKEIEKLIPNGKKGKLLDVGCGTGDFVSLVREKKYSFYGVDISQKMINACKKRFNDYRTIFMKSDIENLKFTDEEFDVVISVGVLEYIKCDFRASRELYRVLKKGGTIIVTFPNKSSPFLLIEKLLGIFSSREKSFHREYSSGRAMNLLRLSGFRNLNEIYVSYLPVNVGIRVPFSKSLDKLLGIIFKFFGLECWGLTRIIKARK